MKKNTSRSALSRQNQIQGLKQEVFQMKDLDYDIFRLNDDVASIEAKYAMVLEEQDRNQQFLKSKMQITKKNLQDLHTDVSGIRLQIEETSLAVDNLYRDNITIQKTCDSKENQINSLNIALKQLEKTNQMKNIGLQELEQMMIKVKQHKSKMEEQCDRLCRRLDQNKDILKDLDKQTKNQIVIEKSLGSTLEKLKYQGNDLETQMKARQALLNQVDQQQYQLTDQVSEAIETNEKLQKQKKKLQQTNSQLTKTLQHNQRINKEKKIKLENLEQQFQQASQDFQKQESRKEQLRKQHLGLAKTNKDLSLQIDDCLLKILQLESLNKGLQRHIENYIDCDQEARILLDRKQKMTEVLQTVGQKLTKTQQVIAHLR